jgi:hypothetical protein
MARVCGPFAMVKEGSSNPRIIPFRNAFGNLVNEDGLAARGFVNI